MRQRFRNQNYSNSDIKPVTKIAAVDAASFYDYPNFKLRAIRLTESRRRKKRNLAKRIPKSFKKIKDHIFRIDRKSGRELADNHDHSVIKSTEIKTSSASMSFILLISIILFMIASVTLIQKFFGS
jgi:hypothetical protein